jgi:hypothetical protein
MHNVAIGIYPQISVSHWDTSSSLRQQGDHVYRFLDTVWSLTTTCAGAMRPTRTSDPAAIVTDRAATEPG